MDAHRSVSDSAEMISIGIARDNLAGHSIQITPSLAKHAATGLLSLWASLYRMPSHPSIGWI